jgi:hypothetical protein
MAAPIHRTQTLSSRATQGSAASSSNRGGIAVAPPVAPIVLNEASDDREVSNVGNFCKYIFDQLYIFLHSNHGLIRFFCYFKDSFPQVTGLESSDRLQYTGKTTNKINLKQLALYWSKKVYRMYIMAPQALEATVQEILAFAAADDEQRTHKTLLENHGPQFPALTDAYLATPAGVIESRVRSSLLDVLHSARQLLNQKMLDLKGTHV